MARQRRQPSASASTTRRRRRRPQVKRILNVRPSEKTEEDWGFEEATDASVVAAAPSIPASKDLRATWWRINDQGTTGSCVGWATADSVVRWHFAKAARITRSELLSPRFVWMAAKETDQFNTRPTTFAEAEGTSLKAALDITRKFGVIKDLLLPFKSGALYQGDARTLYAIASQLKVLAYFNLGSNVANWRTWIATKGPILTRLDVDDTWQKATSTKGELADYHPNKTVGGHAVALVGYGPDRFIVRNSWGSGWGDKGYAYASLDYAQAAFTEAYGIEI